MDFFSDEYFSKSTWNLPVERINYFAPKDLGTLNK